MSTASPPPEYTTLISVRATRTIQRIPQARLYRRLPVVGTVPFEYSNKKWIAAIQELGGIGAAFDPLLREL